MVKKVLAAAVFIAALSASALSIQQLRTSSRVMAACGDPCVKTTACQKPCGFATLSAAPRAYASRKALRLLLI